MRTALGMEITLVIKATLTASSTKHGRALVVSKIHIYLLLLILLLVNSSQNKSLYAQLFNNINLIDSTIYIYLLLLCYLFIYY